MFLDTGFYCISNAYVICVELHWFRAIPKCLIRFYRRVLFLWSFQTRRARNQDVLSHHIFFMNSISICVYVRNLSAMYMQWRMIFLRACATSNVCVRMWDNDIQGRLYIFLCIYNEAFLFAGEICFTRLSRYFVVFGNVFFSFFLFFFFLRTFATESRFLHCRTVQSELAGRFVLFQVSKLCAGMKRQLSRTRILRFWGQASPIGCSRRNRGCRFRDENHTGVRAVKGNKVWYVRKYLVLCVVSARKTLFRYSYIDIKRYFRQK